jgi:hypothetical protein
VFRDAFDGGPLIGVAVEGGLCCSREGQGKKHPGRLPEGKLARAEEALAEAERCGIPYSHRTLLLLVK